MPNGRTRPIVWVGMPIGGVGIIAGAFVPWAVSGRVARNAFELADLAGRLGKLDAVLPAVAFVIPLLCAAPTVMLAMRAVRTAGVAAVLVSIAALAGAGWALSGLGDHTNGMVRIAVTGPAVTAAAASLLLIAALATVRWGRSPRRVAPAPDSAAKRPFAPHEGDATP